MFFCIGCYIILSDARLEYFRITQDTLVNKLTDAALLLSLKGMQLYILNPTQEWEALT